MQPWITAPRLIGLDLETTGLDPDVDRVVSYALVNTFGASNDNWARITQVVHPGEEALPISASAVEVHGITTERALKGVPECYAVNTIVETLVSELQDGGMICVANASFDLTFLDRACRRAGVSTLHERAEEVGVAVCVVDPMLLDRWWDRRREGRRRLCDLCGWYGITHQNPHDALSDAEAAVELSLKLLELAYDEPAKEVEGMCSTDWGKARRSEITHCVTPWELHQLQRSWNESWRAATPGRVIRDWPVAPIGG